MNIKFSNILFLLTLMLGMATFNGCADAAREAAKNKLSIGGTVSGLLGNAEISLNGNTRLELKRGDTAFNFRYALKSHTKYSVIVSRPPDFPVQVCEVNNGTGNANTNITNIQIICSDLVQPKVTSITPEKNSPAADQNQPITIVFDEPIAISTTESADVFIELTQEGRIIPGVISADQVNQGVLVFKPNVKLMFLTNFHLKVKTTVKDLAGKNLLEDYQMDFTTGDGAWREPKIYSGLSNISGVHTRFDAEDRLQLLWDHGPDENKVVVYKIFDPSLGWIDYVDKKIDLLGAYRIFLYDQNSATLITNTLLSANNRNLNIKAFELENGIWSANAELDQQIVGVRSDDTNGNTKGTVIVGIEQSGGPTLATQFSRTAIIRDVKNPVNKWSITKLVSLPESRFGPKVYVSTVGNALMLFEKGSGYYARSYTSTVGWGTELDNELASSGSMSSGLVGYNQLEMDRQGRAILLWNMLGGRHLYLSYFNLNTPVTTQTPFLYWDKQSTPFISDVTSLSEVILKQEFKITFDDNGNALITGVSADSTTNKKLLFSRYYNESKRLWDNTERSISGYKDDINQYQISFGGASDKAIAVWRQLNAPRLSGAKYTIGYNLFKSTWVLSLYSGKEILPAPGLDAENVTARMDKFGNYFICWKEFENVANRTKIRCQKNTQGFEGETQDIITATGDIESYELLLDSQGRAAIVWRENNQVGVRRFD